MNNRGDGKKMLKTLLGGLGLLACVSLPWAGPARAASLHLRLGNPSQATTDTRQMDNFLMEKPCFALSYNNSKGTPNWVSWRLTKTDLGDASRTQFMPDPSLPAGFTRILPRDYTGSGFDRGHLCPHGDRSANGALSQATFVMTNMVPQAPPLNQKAWEQLEAYCRDLVANHGKTLYIVAGPWGQGGKGRVGSKDTIGTERHVTVPAKCWKVILVLDAAGDDGPQSVNDKTRMIGVIMPNDMSVGERWAGFRVPVKQVEALTGYTCFGNVPEPIIGPLKERVDKVRITLPPRPDASADR